ncbi:hypothetical protein BDN72DRAFT_902258 [Pluteus cervinus]|uniref:Uncharacterized protein n=1 Tax=Pluteus cervinus TaxID=181527 RepID=A0ACD3ADF0_9AGAR|nr:hypothetical protein BDN72DRAFT_902258 [Pluteus cervinus]
MAVPKLAHPTDLLPEVLEETFSFKFPFITQHPKHQRDRRLVGTSPFMIYDRHVNDGQRLKYVASLPSLVDDITRTVDDRLAELKTTETGLLPLRHATRADFLALVKGRTDDEDEEDEEMTTSFLKMRIRYRLSFACLPLVSSWAIHPRAPKYYSALQFYAPNRAEIPPATADSPCEGYKIRFVPRGDVHADVLNSVDDTVKGVMADWYNRDLLTCIFLPVSLDSEKLVQNLDQLSNKGDTLPSPRCATQGFPLSLHHFCVSDDAKTTPWALPLANREAGVCADNSDSGDREPSTAGGIVHPRHLDSLTPSKFQQMKDPTPEGLAHHVWRLAVQNDTTVIVINCGNYERIGIRHRASQTLYLSDMVDLTKPGYGKFYLGVLMSAVDDMLTRYQAFRNQRTAARPTKRSRSPVQKNSEVRRSKRQKLNALLERSRDRLPLNKRDSKMLWNEMTKRPLLLLRFSGGGLNSSVPACCIRTGGSLSPHVQDTIDYSSATFRQSYQPSEYCLLTLNWENSNGITGQVFTGHLQVTLPNGRKLLRNVVAKVAYFRHTRERVRAEYQIYQRLWNHKVKRIPEIYGLFEDVDNLATMLVMERAAYTFRQREPVTKENEVACIDFERDRHAWPLSKRSTTQEFFIATSEGKTLSSLRMESQWSLILIALF